MQARPTHVFDPLAEPCPADYPSGQGPTNADITYKTFHRSQTSPAIPLYIDQWDPTLDDQAEAPALVLFHGGGWHQSCRRLFADEAPALADAGYIVFSADYRLACQPSDNPSVDEAPLCGWQYPTIDPVTHAPGAAMQDVQDAVAWVKSHAGDYWSGFNGNVAAIGGSSGGNLLYRGAGVLSVDDDRRPVVVGGWSGPTYFGDMDPGQDELFLCDGAWTQEEQASCWQAVIRYTSCDINGAPVGGACWQKYEAAEPIEAYTSTGPPAFIANSDEEMVNILNQSDFAARLQQLDVDQDPCTVPGHGHGRAYVLDGHCTEHTGMTVLQAQVDFFADYVYP